VTGDELRPLRAFDITLLQGNSESLPFRDETFDCVVMHLIVAVVANPVRALAEARRVLRAGGRVLVLDKFLRPGESAPLRRLMSPVTGRVATRFDVVFESVLAQVPGFEVVSDEPALFGGWFRRIELKKA
jgi:ubiquinone/menaquinone biosynthesis C-methylase UbiE